MKKKNLKMSDKKIRFSEMVSKGYTQFENGESLSTDPLLCSMRGSISEFNELSKEDVLKELTAMNDFMENEIKLNGNSSTIKTMKDNLKTIFDVENASLGFEAKGSVLNDVLLENNELSTSLFLKMVENTYQKNGDVNKLDLDLASVLYMGSLDTYTSGLGTEGSVEKLLGNKVINSIINGKQYNDAVNNVPDNENPIDGLLNGFKTFNGLKFISSDIEGHLEKNKKKLKNPVLVENMRDARDSYDENTELTKQENGYTEQEQAQYDSTIGAVKDHVKDENIVYQSGNEQDSRMFKEAEESAAEMKAVNKKANEVKDYQMNVVKNMESVIQESMYEKKFVYTDYYEKVRAGLNPFNDDLKYSNKNPFLKSLDQLDANGYRLGTNATYNILTGKAVVGREYLTERSVLEATMQMVYMENQPKEGEKAELHLAFDGDPSTGAAYIEAALHTAATMVPPLYDIEDITVPKRFQYLKDNAIQNFSAKMSGKPLADNAPHNDNDEEKRTLDQVNDRRNRGEEPNHSNITPERGVPENTPKSSNGGFDTVDNEAPKKLYADVSKKDEFEKYSQHRLNNPYDSKAFIDTVSGVFYKSPVEKQKAISLLNDDQVKELNEMTKEMNENPKTKDRNSRVMMPPDRAIEEEGRVLRGMENNLLGSPTKDSFNLAVSDMTMALSRDSSKSLEQTGEDLDENQHSRSPNELAHARSVSRFKMEKEKILNEASYGKRTDKENLKVDPVTKLFFANDLAKREMISSLDDEALAKYKDLSKRVAEIPTTGHVFSEEAFEKESKPLNEAELKELKDYREGLKERFGEDNNIKQTPSEKVSRGSAAEEELKKASATLGETNEDKEKKKASQRKGIKPS